jgi:TP901 family phage tail tape measure protein
MLEARDLASGVIARLRTQLSSLSGPQKLLAAGFAAAAVGGTAAAYEIGKFGVHATEAAAKYQQMNTLLTTQAGVAKNRIAGLNDEFLRLAPTLGTTAGNLTQSFYHIASASVPVREQLTTLKSAAEGAAIGNANLEDTTNSLVGVLRSGVGGIHGARDAMAQIMAIVGTGNMRLQDFNSAMGTGLPGAAKTFRVSLKSAGAALAYLTDTGMRAQMAATRLTMAIALMGGPSEHAAKLLGAMGLASSDIHTRFAAVTQMLQKAGLSTSQLAADMHKPDGIMVALQDLKKHFEQAGMSAQLQAAFISRAFGGGHMGKAIMQLFESLPKVGQKFDAINKSVGSFGAHWEQTTKTAVFQAHSIGGAFDSIKLAIGEGLLPAVQKLLGALIPVISKVTDFATKHKTLTAIILGAAFAVSILVAAIGMVGLAMLAFAPISLTVLGIIALVVAAVVGLAVAAYEIYKNWGAIAAFFGRIWGDIKRYFMDGIHWVEAHWKDLAVVMVGLLTGGIGLLPMLIATHWEQVKQVTKRAWDDIRGYLDQVWNRIIADAMLYWTIFRGWLGGLWGAITSDLSTAWSNIWTFLDNLWVSIQTDAGNVWGGIVSFFTGLWDGIAGVWNSVWGGIKSALGTVWGWIAGGGDWVWTNVSSGFKTIWDGIGTAWYAVWGGAKQMLHTIWGWIAGGGDWAWGKISNGFQTLWDGLGTAWYTVWSGAKSMLNGIWGWISGLGGIAWGKVSTAMETLWDGLGAAWGKAWKTVRKIFTAGVDSVIGVIDWLIKHWNKLHFHFGGFKVMGITVVPAFDVGLPHLPTIPMLADGGIVTSATLAMIGEAGPEAVIPLSRMGGMGGGGQTVVLDFRNSQFWGPQDVDAFVQRFGSRFAQYLLPASGMQVRRG